jgi:hypothetical protein
MTGQIPKYGAFFRRQSVDFEPGSDLASTIYVLKLDANWHIRSNGSSDKWWVFYRKTCVSLSFGLMRDAMKACRGAQAALALTP